MRHARKGVWRWLIAACAVGMVAAACSGGGDTETVAVIFVGHGEPAEMAKGDVSITFPDGTAFGPHAETLGVPAEFQDTEWAAAYDEIATAMTYIFDDVNGNGIGHELMVSPAGDVPPFFTWEAFHDELDEMYEAFDGYSPHNDLITELVADVDLDVDGADVHSHLAFLDAVPRIPDIMWDIRDEGYDRIVVVPLLLSSSTHTTEIEELIEESADDGVPVTMAEPFFEVPYMRARVQDAVLAMADYVRQGLPSNVSDDELAVLLVAHGTPYVPAHEAFGYQEGDIFSNLPLTESLFHEEIDAALRWPSRNGKMNYASPSIEESLAAFEADGIKHVMVIPSAFPTASSHTMWHVAVPAMGRSVTPDEGIVSVTRPSGMTVHYSAEGYADLEYGRQQFLDGLGFTARVGVMEALQGNVVAGS